MEKFSNWAELKHKQHLFLSGYFKQRERLLFSQKQFSRLKGILNISETVSVMECVFSKTDQCDLATKQK